MAAALCYSVGAILIRRAPPIPPMVFTAGMLIAGSLVLIPLALLVEGVPEVTNTQATWALLYAGILPTGLAFLLRVVLIRSAGPIFMSLVAYIVPLWAVVLGVILLDETLRLSTYIGAIIILLAVGLTQLRFLRPR